MRALMALVWKELLDHWAYPLGLLHLALPPGLLVAPYLVVAKVFGAGVQSSVTAGLLLWYWLSTR